MQRYGDDPAPYAHGRVAASLAAKAWLLLKTSDYDGTIATVEDLLDGCGGTCDVNVSRHVAYGIVAKVNALEELGRWNEAISSADDACRRFGDETDPELRRRVAGLLAAKAHAHMRLVEIYTAAEVWQELVDDRFDDLAVSSRDAVALEVEQMSRILVSNGQPARASRLMISLVEHEGGQLDPRLVMHAQLVRCAELVSEDRSAEAISIIDEVIARADGVDEPGLRSVQAGALNLKVVALEDVGRTQEADEAFHTVATRFGREALAIFDETIAHHIGIDSSAEESLARALASKAAILQALDRHDEALETLDELDARFRDSRNTDVRSILAAVTKARQEMTH